MADRNIRHVGDVFGEDTGKPAKQQNLLDRKTSFNMFKNKQAPKPPQGQQALPRIGNYQPKILLEPKTSNYNREPPMERSKSPERQNEMPPTHSNFNSVPAKPMIIGDKDELIRIADNDDEDEERQDEPVAPPRRKRKAPEAPVAGPSGIQGFVRSISQRSDEERFEMEEQGGDIDFAEGIDNPAFSSRARSESSSSYRTSNHDRSNERPPRPKSEQISYPYIPPPDYEDEEVTLDFEEEAEEFLDFNRNSRNSNTVYRELEGDDFGKYLEDDYEFDAPNMGPPNSDSQFGKSRTVPRTAKQQKYSKQDNKKASKARKKQDKREANMKRNTIRDFTFSDSKIGWGDRTVKSTSAKGRYIKREKDRKRIDHNAQFPPQNGGPGSYEDFLRAKNGIPLESPNSSDSGVEMGEDSRMMEDMYLNNQPKQMRSGKFEHKPSFLQRLTWRFKKNVTVTRQEREPEVLDYRF